MFKKMLGVFTSVVAGLAVVGVAWASGDDGTSTSVTAATDTSATVSSDVSTPSTAVTLPDSPSTSVSASSSTSANASTSTSIAGTTSTSAAGGSTTSTSIGSSSSTSVDDSDRRGVPDGVTAHNIPGVGTVTIEVVANQLFLVNVTAPGWNVEHDKIESDRIELEFTNASDVEAEFEARINDGRVEVRIEVD